jgi:hypothetical protein
MLDDVQTDRYSRQIVLSEIGGRGQERLLASTVTIHGGGDAASICASQLAGAGVGGLVVSNAALRSELAREGRNPDCAIVDRSSATADLVVGIGDMVAGLDCASPILWGFAEEERVSRVYFPAGRACLPCLEDLLRRRERGNASAQALGALLALDALRVLLGLEDGRDPSRLQIDLTRGSAQVQACRSRPDCPSCACITS